MELQPEYKKEYQIDRVWKQIDSLANYEEFLQTQVSFSVKDCLQGLRNAVGMNVQMPKEEIPRNRTKGTLYYGNRERRKTRGKTWKLQDQRNVL